MAVYEYSCQACGEASDHFVKYDDRLTKQDCPHCNARASAEYRMSAPAIGTERKRGDRRLIVDERQVASEKGERWRDEGTTGTPGGVGRKIHFHD